LVLTIITGTAPVATTSTLHLPTSQAPCVIFNPVVTTASGSIIPLHQDHESDPDDPFVGSGNPNTRSILFSSGIQVHYS